MFRFFARIASRPQLSRRRTALAALARGDFATAERELTALLDVAGTTGATRAERAFLFNKRGVARAALARPQEARDDFTGALECVAGFAPALTNLGNLAIEEGRLEEAIARYEAAIASDADYAVAHFNLGVAFKRAGRVDDAVRALRRAQRLEGTSFLRRRRRSSS